MKFVKIKINKDDLMPCWWEYDDSTPIFNATLKNMGFGQNSGNDLSGYEIVEAKSWFDLNWEGTKVYSSIYHTGWVSPNGEFYGCDCEYHDKQAMFVHKVSLRELEKLGFIKITKKLYGNEYIVLNTSNVTISQYEWFKNNYVLPNREEVIERLKWHLKLSLNKENINEQIF